MSPWVLIVGLGLASLLGGLHALTPGHGKTLIAAYLVGSRGITKHAFALGGIVTVTHTASVIIIGLLALFASQFIVPNVLEIVSGLLVVVMGVRLVWARRRNLRSGTQHEGDHAHTHTPVRDHTHEHTHDHTGGHSAEHAHSHVIPSEGLKLSSLLAMGVSGGLVPCPEALGIMVIAVGLNRILLGLGLIVSFSFGLAAVLITLGILLVHFRSVVGRLDRLGNVGSSTQRVLPLVSAVIVTALGVGIALQGLLAYMIRT